MGYLLKEALKTLCGVNHWSYAVFWKFGCQNPKLLIWEECYTESGPLPGLLELPGSGDPENGFHDYDASWLSVENQSLQSVGKVHLLVNKMMLDSHVRILGEGLVGRVAFTGSHQWILSETYYNEAHPPEVLKEVCRQFSAGIQTIVVIPVLPLGVIQFGSLSTIAENMGFVYDVASLVLQLGSVSSAFLSNDSAAKEQATKVEVPVCLGSSDFGGPLHNSDVVDTSSLLKPPNYRTTFVSKIQNEVHTNVAAFQTYNSFPSNCRPHQYPRISLAGKFNYSSLNRLTNGVAKAEVISSNSELLMNQNASLCDPCSTLQLPSSGLSTLKNGMTRCMGPSSFSDTGNQSCFSTAGTSLIPAIMENSGLMYCSNDGSASRVSVSDMKPMSVVNFASDEKRAKFVPGFVENDGGQIASMNDTKCDNACVQPGLGDDLFDILGPDYKNRLFSSHWNSLLSNEPVPTMHDILPKKSLAYSEIYSTSQGNSDSAIFSSAGADDLLEAVVSQVHHSAKASTNDSVSCRTALTNASGSTVPNSSLPYGCSEALTGIKGELFGLPKYPTKTGATSSWSLRSSSSMEESGVYSQGSSFCGSQISSWMEKDQKGNQTNSVSTGCSKKPHKTGKTSCKRFKPGENPRPRPKDRQMIQDRVKELREIVPNGAKCSIDALLEHTIKHMLFLQSVMKHADKLKQTGESKIVSQDGGLHSKGNFEGGVTWAYEVGSQSMICPIRVEDLNQPRQMLVEMICEERGLFLEIADIIRGLGLTILKGVMETRDNKIWSRFTVEANRDVTRMEIFISLVHLLEQSAKTGAMQPSENLAISSVPANL